MLNNIIFNESLHFFIKNNMTLTNTLCFKTINFILININVISINYIEKFNAEYYLKKILINLLSFDKQLIYVVTQLLVLIIFL